MGLSPFFNAVEVYAANAAGVGSVTLGAAVNSACLTMSEAGAVDGQKCVFRFDAANGDFELSRCTYSAAGPSVSRDQVLVSKIGGAAGTSKITVATTTTCRLVVAAEDVITRQQAMSRSWLIGG